MTPTNASAPRACPSSSRRWASLAFVVASLASGATVGCARGPIAVDPSSIEDGRVRLTSHVPTEGAPREIGPVEVTVTGSLQAALEAFAREVAHLGGNVGVVGSIRSKLEVRDDHWIERRRIVAPMQPDAWIDEPHDTIRENAPIVVSGRAFAVGAVAR